MTKYLPLLDLLLPIAVVLFLMPISPSISSLPATIWVMLQLICSPTQKRWALWPLAFVVLAMGRSWWLNEMPHPAASEDILLIITSFLAATGISQNRWPQLLKTILLPLPLLLLQLSSSPWTPNPTAGRNQTTYLIGLLAIISICWLWSVSKSKLNMLFVSIPAFFCIFLLWHSQSRAGVIATAIALLAVKLREEHQKGTMLKFIPVAAILGISTILSLKFLRPSSVISLTGFDFISDMGRIDIQRCYLQLPFSGNNRFIYGTGYENSKNFCHQQVTSGILDHAHNIYIQLWANAGILGLFGLGICIYLLIDNWRKLEHGLDEFALRTGQAAFLYIFVQGFFDVSLIHWPITQVFTGILLAIPLSVNGSVTTPDRS